MSENELRLKRIGEGSYEIPFNYGQMKDIVINNWLEKHDFSNTRLLSAAALSCISLSMEYELDSLKKGARFTSLEPVIKWKNGKDESGRNIIESMEIDLKVDVPDELKEEYKAVLDEHTNHCCFILRSLKRGIPIKLNINET
jgi:uncharacterized OsmC-like protein